MTPGKDDFWFLPLGGCGEIGMNLNVYGHNGRWLIVDCGVTFQAEVDEFGEPLNSQNPPIQMADPQFLIDRRQQLDGLIITHAHEDHIGAVPYLWEYFRCPVYTTAFTAEMLRRKLVEQGIADKVPVIIVEADAKRQIGVFQVEWLRLTHSIPEPYALLISTAVGKVFHTADWKLDNAPVVGQAYDAAAFQKLAEYQVDAMVCDSTNANVQGWSESEANLYKGLKFHVEQAKGRVVVACFGSNIARLHTLAGIAEETGRHLGLLGRSLINTVSAAKNVGLWTSVKTSVDSAHLGYLPAHTVLLVATGSQGEPRTALNRLSLNSFRDLQLSPGDTVIFSSKVIPGNELAIAALIERLKAMQVDVIDMDNSALPIHASGHPASEELKTMYQWVQPQCAIPVHGELMHMKANAKIAKASGVRRQLLGQNGDLFYISPVNGIRRGAVKTGRWGLFDRKTLKKL
ncbi:MULTISPECIES: ribonuclease J [unclassified Methylophaga]|uniref:ribonuclease J n=1 Tax=unclassified Methylophaga TaxID=2629249 RepID=UPI000C916926|nr:MULTISPECIES: ribonuclease J [unclassified Methylophaga]MBN45041.1 MBL fold metallo-hydrolase [Methylophaga sp.]|tara:strand:- start:15285 stop:16661 length:1377 start_codon:yes stop_codon:yes gene_type:complete